MINKGSMPISKGTSASRVTTRPSVGVKTFSEHNKRTYTAPGCRAPAQPVWSNLPWSFSNRSAQLWTSKHNERHPIILENGQGQRHYCWLHLGIHFMPFHTIYSRKLHQHIRRKVVNWGIERRRAVTRLVGRSAGRSVGEGQAIWSLINNQKINITMVTWQHMSEKVTC